MMSNVDSSICYFTTAVFICVFHTFEFITYSFQTKRLGALNKFKSKERSILIATDVASRGLDIPHVDIVINFDIPTHSKVSRSMSITVIVFDKIPSPIVFLLFLLESLRHEF